MKGDKAEGKKEEPKEEMERKEEEIQRRPLLTSKHAWTMELSPTKETKRLYAIEGLPRMRTPNITRWFLCEHNLEIETGRSSRIPKEQIYCRACKAEKGEDHIGDEIHALSICCRNDKGRTKRKDDLRKILTEASEEATEDWDSSTDIWQLMKKIQNLKTCQQKLSCNAVALLMSGIDMEIKKPKKAARRKAAENPNPAMINKCFAQEQTGARGRSFRKRKRE